MRMLYIAALSLTLLLPPTVAIAQVPDGEPFAPVVRTAEVEQAPASAPAPENPWARRPACASLFLKSDWQLTGKQRACDWIQNRVFSNGALFGAASSAFVSKVRDSAAEEGDPYGIRFGRRYAQSAFKSSAAYLGGVIAGEDPRIVPPYLVMKARARPRGFWRRTRHALANNLTSYACVGECRSEKDIKRRFALSRVLGAIASGYGSEVWTWDRATSHSRAWRGAASAYGSSFADAIYTEFKPELNAAAGKVFGGLFGFR